MGYRRSIKKMTMVKCEHCGKMTSKNTVIKEKIMNKCKESNDGFCDINQITCPWSNPNEYTCRDYKKTSTPNATSTKE